MKRQQEDQIILAQIEPIKAGPPLLGLQTSVGVPEVPTTTKYQ